MKKTAMLPALIRSAEFEPATIDAEKRSVDLVWSVGARVYRPASFFDEPFFEELSMEPSAIRMERMNSGAAPLLKNHDQSSLDSVMGAITKSWLKDGQGMSSVRFSSRADVQPFFQDVQDGIIRNVSVGYRVYKYQDVSMPNDQVRTLRAIDWEPLEVSLVPVGADASAGIRSESDKHVPCEIVNPTRAESAQGDIMPPEIEPTAPAAQPIEQTPSPAAPAAAPQESARAAVEGERTRFAEITKSVRKAGLDSSVAEDLISRGVSLDAARAVIIDKLAERTEQSNIRPVVSGGTPANQASRMIAASESILHRFDPSRNKLSDDSREFRGQTLMEMARNFLEASGKRTIGLSKMEIATRAFEGTSDFPALLANVANKTLREAYEQAPQTFRPLVKLNMASDFKQMARVQLSDAPSLEQVGPSGEIKKGAMTDGKEVYSLATFAKIVPINRQAIINDDTSAFTRIPALMGRAAADLESDTVWAIITANAAMNDGVALFHATHKNLAVSGAAMTTLLIGAARAAMKSQKNMANRPMNVLPKFLIVDPNTEYLAEQTVGPIVPNAASSFNPFMGKLSILSEPRLTVASGTQPWYVAADPGQIDTIEISYLEGQQGVYLETKQGFEVDGMEIKARLDFAAKALDWRGLYKNPGV